MNIIFRNWLIIFLGLSFISIQAQSQQSIEFEQFSSQEGLSQNSVYCLLQDKRHFIWIGTQDGLNQFDGYTFKVYKTDTVNSISSNKVNAILEDDQGVLWIATDRGLNAFDFASQSFQNYFANAKNTNSLISDNILSLAEDKAGNIWIGTDQGLSRLNPSRSKFERFLEDTGAIQSLLIDKRGQLWVGTHQGLWRASENSTEFTFFPYLRYPGGTSLEKNAIKTLYEDAKGTIWIGTERGLFNYTQEGEQARLINLLPQGEEVTINALQEKSPNKLWIGTAGEKYGIFVWDMDQDTLLAHHKNSPNPNSLSKNYIYTFLQDHAGGLWIGTNNGGVAKVNQTRQSFEHYYHREDDPKSLGNNKVRSILEDHRGTLWVGTFVTGLNRWDAPSQSFKKYMHDPNNPKSISDNNILSVYEDSEKRLWIGTEKGGLNYFDRRAEVFAHFMANPDNAQDPMTVNNNQIRCLLEDSKGKLWIGTYGGGLNCMDLETGKFIHYTHNPDDPTSLRSNIVYSLLEDSQGRLWVGTRGGGLSLFNDGKFKHYVHDGTNSSSISNDIIMCIFEDKDQKIWVGTYGGALNLFKERDETFIHYNESKGLPNDVAYGILQDNEGYLWISTNKGISRFHPDSSSFTNYDQLDGLQSDEFNGGAYHKGRKTGKFYFGGINGFNAFHPNNIQKNRNKPKVYISDFQIFNFPIPIGQASTELDLLNNIILTEHISQTRVIELAYTQNVLTFEFVSLDYTRPEKNQYQYILEGFDKDWRSTSADRRLVTYTNLDPGHYHFRVKGSNNDGLFGKEKCIEIHIKPPIWATWWFRILVALIIIVGTYSSYVYRVNRIKKRKEVLEREVHRQTAQINQQKEEIQATLDNLRGTQTQLVQSEKMASLGQLTAGIAHEINNPINFVAAGINSLKANIQDLIEVLENYDEVTPDNAEEKLKEILELKEDIEFDEVLEEVNDLVNSIQNGASRTTEIVKGLRTFSRLDEDDVKMADMHENLDATLSILRNQYKNRIEIVKDYGKIPKIECYPGKLNQVFMNILANAIQAIEGNGTITIKTSKDCPPIDENLSGLITNASIQDFICIFLKDSGSGMPDHVKKRIFEPFYTTKDVGQGTGLGLSIVHSIIEKHHGNIQVDSEMGVGTEFIIQLPLKLPKSD